MRHGSQYFTDAVCGTCALLDQVPARVSLHLAASVRMCIDTSRCKCARSLRFFLSAGMTNTRVAVHFGTAYI
jgi:hypothetical protein